MLYKSGFSLGLTTIMGSMLAASSPAALSESGEYVRCESRHGNYTRCETHTRGEATLERQLSNASCRRGRSWGYSNGAIWVDNGCRAEFKVRSDNEDYWGHDDNANKKSVRGRCKLVDRDRDRIIFNKGCKVKFNKSSRTSKYVFKIDTGRKFVFKDTGDGYYISSREGGTVPARFRSPERSKDVFVWNNWRLVFVED